MGRCGSPPHQNHLLPLANAFPLFFQASARDCAGERARCFGLGQKCDAQRVELARAYGARDAEAAAASALREELAALRRRQADEENRAAAAAAAQEGDARARAREAAALLTR